MRRCSKKRPIQTELVAVWFVATRRNIKMARIVLLPSPIFRHFSVQHVPDLWLQHVTAIPWRPCLHHFRVYRKLVQPTALGCCGGIWTEAGVVGVCIRRSKGRRRGTIHLVWKGLRSTTLVTVIMIYHDMINDVSNAVTAKRLGGWRRWGQELMQRLTYSNPV